MMGDRYSRQVLFPGIGALGQERILSSRMLIVGCGALGSSQAEMLARAGIGRLRIVDRDFVEFSNLQRQTLFSESDAAERLPKAVAAKRRLARVNSDVQVEEIIADVNNSNIRSLIDGCDVVLDGTDNFQVRYLVNDACVEAGIDWIYGAAVSSYGTTMTVRPGVTPCLRCIFEDMPAPGSSPTCDTAGVIMPIISMVTATQVTEALKLAVGDVDGLHGSLLQFDVWSNDRQKISLDGPVPGCVCCSLRKFEFLDAEAAEFAAVLCGRDAVQIAPARPSTIDIEELSRRLGPLAAEMKLNDYLLRFNVEGKEVTVFRDARAIIKNTDDATEARSIYARFVGL